MKEILLIEVGQMVKKKGERSMFGTCLLLLRRQKGWTQTELGKKVRLSKRMIAHYERHGERIPVNHLINLAHALGVTVDLLLGLKPIKATASPKTARLLNRLRRVETLHDRDRKAVLDYIEALIIKSAQKKT